MRKYGFSLTSILPHEDRIYDSAFIRENTGQWKPFFSYILCSVNDGFYRVFGRVLNDIFQKLEYSLKFFHCVKYGVFSDPYFPWQNRRFYPYTGKYQSGKILILAYFTQCLKKFMYSKGAWPNVHDKKLYLVLYVTFSKVSHAKLTL